MRVPTPPVDLECERAILGAALWSAEAAATVGSLTPELFWSEAHRDAVRAIARLVAAGTPVDGMTLRAALEGAGFETERLPNLQEGRCGYDDAVELTQSVHTYSQPVATTCAAPNPNTARRSAHKRAGSTSSPIRKSNSTMPISAKARTPSTSPASASPHGPIAAPATM